MIYIVLAILVLEIVRLIISISDSRRVAKLNTEVQAANLQRWNAEVEIRRTEDKYLAELVKGSKQLEKIILDMKAEAGDANNQ